MDISQSDRDKLRASQHLLLNSKEFGVIGKLIEHKVQDPKIYKKLSREAEIKQSENKSGAELTEASICGIGTRVQYTSQYYKDQNVPMETEEQPKVELPFTPADIQSNLWLNMNQIEFEKLEWMSSKAEKAYREQLKKTTRFDAEGRAVPISHTITNGDEPRITIECDEEIADSHDIESLINMLDSKFNPQVTYSLSVISKIASLATMGYYDGAFSENIHEILLKNALLRVRHRLDSPNESNRQNALKCLRSLLCNTQVDEVVLDRIHPLISDDYDRNIWLSTQIKDQKDFGIEMKDNECVEKDAILALVHRTNIIGRFTYLLGTSISHTYYECILDILIRIARHSISTCIALNHKELLVKIVDLFLPTSLTSQTNHLRGLSVKAMKLIRIIAQALSEYEDIYKGQAVHEKLELAVAERTILSIRTYFFVDCLGSSVNEDVKEKEHNNQLFKLHIETLRLMKTIGKIQKYRSHISDLMTMGQERICSNFRLLHSLSSKKEPDNKISFDWQLAAHLIDLSGFVARNEKCHYNRRNQQDTIWISYVKPILFKWINELTRIKMVPHLDVSIALAVAVHHYGNRVDEPAIRDLIGVMIAPIVEYPNSHNLFKELARSASDKSQLPKLLEENGRLRDPQQLPSYGCLTYNRSSEYQFRLSPLFDTNSPFILLNTFLYVLQEYKSSSYQESLKVFTDNCDILRYIKGISFYYEAPSNYELVAQESFLAQYEVQIIARALILLSHYYLGIFPKADIDEKFKALEPPELKSKTECYSNVCYYVISTVGLASTRSEISEKLKDNLLEQILLDHKLQTRIFNETFLSSSDRKEHEYRDYANGKITSQLLLGNHLQVLVPVYMSREQPNRFWILQPLLDYYFGHQAESTNETAPYRPGKWFEDNIIKRNQTGALASCNDITIVSTILIFNLTMMQCSPIFNHSVVRSNLEDHLCLIGTIFLHDDIFLDEDVQRSVGSNLKTMLKSCAEKVNGKFNVPFKDATKVISLLNLTVIDFFNKLLEQYEAVSYGNEAFSNFMLLFMTPGSADVFKRKVFGEKAETCLRQLRLSRDDVWIPEQVFLSEKEKDPEICLSFKRAGQYIAKGSFLDYYREAQLQY